MVNRRQFFTRLAQGTLGALVVASLPLELVGAEAKQRSAITYLTKSWNDFTKGKGLRGRRLEGHASPALYDAFKWEIMACQRFTYMDPKGPYRENLAFKSSCLYRDVNQSGWSVSWTLLG